MTYPRYFTLEEANGLLEWLRGQLQGIAATREELARLQPQMESLLRAARTNGHGETDARLGATRRAIDSAAERMARAAQEVQDRGILLRDAQRGLVDFPALREGREIFLCWLLGEGDVAYWHETDAGFAGRQPL